MAKIATKPVANKVILATYKPTPATGIKKTGKRKIYLRKSQPRAQIQDIGSIAGKQGDSCNDWRWSQ